MCVLLFPLAGSDIRHVHLLAHDVLYGVRFLLVIKPEQHGHLQCLCLCVSVCVCVCGNPLRVSSPKVTILALRSAGYHGDNKAVAVETFVIKESQQSTGV